MTRLGVGVSVRQMMTMRARVLRQNSTQATPSVDEWGADLPDSEIDEIRTSMPCVAWSPTDDAEVLDEAAGTFGAVRLVVPADADVLEGDTIDDITDRVGRVLFEGPMRVTAVTRRTGHLAVMVRVQQPGQA